MSLVKLNKITKSFAQTGEVLTPIDLAAESGEFLTLLGPSGCGKSTILRLIASLERPSSGSLDVADDSTKSFVFQEAHLLPWRNVLQNVLLPLEIFKVEPKSAHEQALKIIDKVGLSKNLLLLPRQLSGGMKMRVSLARALITKPKLLLLDEPFSALDETIRYRLQEELRNLCKQLKMTVIFVTHSVSEAVFLSDRIVILSSRPGRILLDKKIVFNAERTDDLRTQSSYLELVHELSLFFRNMPDEVLS